MRKHQSKSWRSLKAAAEPKLPIVSVLKLMSRRKRSGLRKLWRWHHQSKWMIAARMSSRQRDLAKHQENPKDPMMIH